MKELKIKKIILEVLLQLPTPCTIDYEDSIRQYLSEIEKLIHEKEWKKSVGIDN